MKMNIAKGTTDPRAEFISQYHSTQFTNIELITISESWLIINFKILTKPSFRILSKILRLRMLMFGWDFEVSAWSIFWRCLIKICERTCDLTKRSYFEKQNSALGSVVPLAMFLNIVQNCENIQLWILSLFTEDCIPHI